MSFDLSPGEIIGLVGESGSGKTVTGFSILGLIDPPGRIAGGSVTFEGRDLVGMPVSELRKLRGRQISMVFQDPSATLNPVLTIGRQMALALEAHGSTSADAARTRSVEVLKQVGIPDRRSGSMPIRTSSPAACASASPSPFALLNRPKLMICDEPTTALDVSIQAQILTEMRGLARDMGTAMIWISHDLATVSSIASRILVMYAGRIIEEGPIKSVLLRQRAIITPRPARLPAGQRAAGQDLVQIPGSTPSLLNLPPGCPFRPRCPRG